MPAQRRLLRVASASTAAAAAHLRVTLPAAPRSYPAAAGREAGAAQNRASTTAGARASSSSRQRFPAKPPAGPVDCAYRPPGKAAIAGVQAGECLLRARDADRRQADRVAAPPPVQAPLNRRLPWWNRPGCARKSRYEAAHNRRSEGRNSDVVRIPKTGEDDAHGRASG